MIFRAYVNKPEVSLYPEHDTGEKRTPPIVAVLKNPVTEASIGKHIKYNERSFRIDNVSCVYVPKMVGETDSHGDYRIVSTTEVVKTNTGAWLTLAELAALEGVAA